MPGNGIEHLDGRSRCVTLITGKLKFAGKYSCKLLVTFEKKNVWTTTVNIHDHSPSGCRSL
jgi:hypothetical protein